MHTRAYARLGRWYRAAEPRRLITRNQIAAINSAATALLNSVHSVNISPQPLASFAAISPRGGWGALEEDNIAVSSVICEDTEEIFRALMSRSAECSSFDGAPSI